MLAQFVNRLFPAGLFLFVVSSVRSMTTFHGNESMSEPFAQMHVGQRAKPATLSFCRSFPIKHNHLLMRLVAGTCMVHALSPVALSCDNNTHCTTTLAHYYCSHARPPPSCAVQTGDGLRRSGYT